MKILCWNVRGPNSRKKLYELKTFASKYDGDLLCFVETKIKEIKASEILNTHFPGWNILSNYNHDGSGRIWILFRDHMVINLYSSSAQGIHCHSFHSINNEYIFSCVYAANAPALRAKLWADLKAIKKCMIPFPWLLVGDYNSILSVEEHS